MNIAGVATVIYGGLIEAGGVIGFLVAKSKPSLIAGSALGTLALVGGVMLLMDFNQGRWVAIGVAGLVALVFSVKLGKALAGDSAAAASAEGDAGQKDAEKKDAQAAHDDKSAKPAPSEKPKKAKGKVRAAALVILSLAEIIVVLVYA